MQIDLNCDMGEWLGLKAGAGIQTADASIMPFISSANIACAMHAGNPLAMEKTICLAIRHGVAIGAHPGYPDPEGFGRRPMNLPPDELRASLLYQVGALKSMTESLGGRMRHVKPHGALYNLAASDIKTARLIALTIKDIDPSLFFVGLAGSVMERAAGEAGLAFVPEVFADRAYQDNGQLVPRTVKGSVLQEPGDMILRVIRMVTKGVVVSVGGKELSVDPGTICIHGDNPSAPAFVQELSDRLNEAGVAIRPFGEV